MINRSYSLRRSVRRASLALVTAAAAGLTGFDASTAHAVGAYNWDPNATNGVTGGGSGTWDISSPLWYNGTSDVPWPNTTAAIASFGGTTAGTVSLGTNIAAGTLTFATTGYTVAGGTYALNLGSGGLTVTATSGTAIISGAALNLTAAQTWTGVSGGLVSISAPIADIAGQLSLAGSGSTFNISGGGSITGQNFVPGAGVITNLTGGTLTSSTLVANSGAAFSVDSGATFYSTNSTLSGQTPGYRNNANNSSLILNGGTIVDSGIMDISHGANVGTFTLSSGLLETQYGFAADSTSSVDIVNFAGATIQITSSLPDLMWASNSSIGTSTPASLTFNDVGGGGGANFNTNGFTLGIAESIVHSGTGTDGGLTKTGAGNLTLTGTNLYNGATNVIAGILKESSAASLPSASVVTVTSGATMELDSSGATYPQSFVLAGSGATGERGALFINNGAVATNTFTGGINISSGATIGSYGVTFVTNFNCVISGSGNLSFNVEGGNVSAHTSTFNFNQNNTYAGSTTFDSGNGNSGIYVNGISNALPTTTSLTLSPQAGITKYNLNGYNQSLSGLNTAGTVANAVLTNSASTYSTLTDTAGGTYQGLISGNINLVNSAGTLYLSTATNTYTGYTNVSGGTLALLSSGSSQNSIPAGNLVNVTSGGALFLDSTAATSVTYSNFNLNMSGGTLQFGNANLATFNFPGNINLTGTDTFASSNIRDQLSISGTIGGTGNLAFNASGAQSSHFLVLSGANNYSGSTLVTNNNTAGASLQLGANNTLPSTTTLTLNGGASFDSQLDLNGFNQSIAGLVATGTLANADVVNSNSTMGALTLNISSGTNTFSGLLGAPAQTLANAAVSGTNLGLIKTGAGVLTLTAANGYTGPTLVQQGELNANGILVLPLSTSAINISNGAFVQVQNHAGIGIPTMTNNFTLNGTNGPNGAINFYNSANFNMSGTIYLASDSALRYDPYTQAASINFTNVISGPGGLTLFDQATNSGTAWFKLSAQNTYQGSTMLTSSATSGSGTFLIELASVNNVLPTTTALSFGGTPTGATGTFNQPVTVELDGINQQVASLTAATGAGAYAVVGNSTTLSTLTIANSAPDTYAGTLGSATANGSNLALVAAGSSTLTLSGSNLYAGGTNVAAGTLVLASGNAFPSGVSNAGTGLIVASGATLQIANHGSGSIFVPIVSSLSNNGTIDITNNALVLKNANTSIGTIAAQIQSAYNSGAWTGTNSSGGVITSTLAASDTTHLTAVGFATGLTSFEGQTVAAGDVLVKYTYYGDADLNGHVDGSDYSDIDNGYLNGLTGWQNGDFNYDGVVDGSDYTLIDNAFNTQGAALAAEISSPAATATAQIAGSGATSSVPEPASLMLVGIGAVGLLGRRRRGH